MKKTEREQILEYINRWKETSEVLAKLEREEFRRANLAETILSFNDASDSALLYYPPQPTSGLIEMQKILAKMKKQ